MRVVLVLLLAIFSACAPKKTPPESTLLKSYRLIDEGRTDEAIDLLEQASAESPDDVELKVTLSSAYARKADVRIQTLAPVVFAVQKYDSLKDASDLKPGISNANSEMTSILTAIEKISSIWAIYTSVPAMTKEQLPYLKHAVHILDANAKQLTPKDHVYRGILKAVFLKAVIENEIMSSPDLIDSRIEMCKPNFVALQSALTQIATVLNDILDDMVIANPSQKEAMERVREQMVLGFKKASVALASLSGGDGSLQAVIRDRAIAEGFGRVFQCE